MVFFQTTSYSFIGFIYLSFSRKKISNKKFLKIPLLSLLITIFSILILLIIKNVSLYDEIRHIMFLIPLIFIIGLTHIYILNKKFFYISGTLTILLFAVENVSINPYQYTWLNSFSKFYNIEKKFELDYWGVSNKNLQLVIKKHYTKNTSIKSNCVYGDLYSNVFLENHGFSCFENYTKLDSAKDRPFYVYKNVRNVKRSDPKDCEMIGNENFKYFLTNKKVSVGSAWFCD